SVPKWHTIMTRRSPDEVWFTLFFPEGLLFGDDAGSLQLPVRMRMRQRGEVDWINLPEIHFVNRGGTPFRKAIKLKWEDAPGGPIPTPELSFSPAIAYKEVPAQTVTPMTGGWSADAWFSAGSGSDVYSIDHA